jgi:hypothetical protein
MKIKFEMLVLKVVLGAVVGIWSIFFYLNNAGYFEQIKAFLYLLPL